VERVILARHGESVFSERLLVNGDVAVPGPLTVKGEEEARALGRAVAHDRIDLCVTTQFERTRQTAEIALAGRDVPRLVVPELNDPRYGRYESGPLEAYRTWADAARSGDDVPGGGESRRNIVERYARGFRLVLARAEGVVLVVAHSLPIAYVLMALAGREPAPKADVVEHAKPYRLERDELERAVARIDAWCSNPSW
jgi:broad specificity phosphatase PhoE